MDIYEYGARNGGSCSSSYEMKGYSNMEGKELEKECTMTMAIYIYMYVWYCS
jgi:hypothetical protein